MTARLARIACGINAGSAGKRIDLKSRIISKTDASVDRANTCLDQGVFLKRRPILLDLSVNTDVIKRKNRNLGKLRKLR